jgi:hypothetical protein
MFRIDVHPAWENLNNTPRTLPIPVYAHPAYTSCGQSLYVATFCWLPRSRNKPIHPEEVLATKDRLTQPSSWAASFFLPCDSPGVGERGFGPVVTQLLQLIGTINTSMRSVRSILARGANPSVLNRHSRGLQPWRCHLATYHTPTFPTSYLHFPPTDPARSPV